MGQHVLSANCVNNVIPPVSFNQLLHFIVFNCHVPVCIYICYMHPLCASELL